MNLSRRAILVGILLSTLPSVRADEGADNAVAKHAARFEKEIAAFEKRDQQSPPPQGAILFVGDSAVRMWKSLADDFPEFKVINRGFGGSILSDSTYFADRIIVPYHPRLIVLKAGGNDLTGGKSPEQISADFKTFVETVRAKLPGVRIAYQSINPNPGRWKQKDLRLKTNALIKAIVAEGTNLDFIEVWSPFLDADGNPRKELFLPDGIHNNPAGYKVLAEIVRPHLKAE
jgi:lysophospholipase L1-like esterase